jgi:hypothetical protein
MLRSTKSLDPRLALMEIRRPEEQVTDAAGEDPQAGAG